MQPLHEADFGGTPILSRQQCDSSRCEGKFCLAFNHRNLASLHNLTLMLISDRGAFYCNLQFCIACLKVKVKDIAIACRHTIFSLVTRSPSALPTSVPCLAAPLRVLIVRLMSTIDSKRISHPTQMTNTNRPVGADLNQAVDPHTGI